jgi:hypothetical protein
MGPGIFVHPRMNFGPGEGEPDGAIAMLAALLLPNATQRGRTTLEAKEPSVSGDIVFDYVQAGGGSF